MTWLIKQKYLKSYRIVFLHCITLYCVMTTTNLRDILCDLHINIL